MRLVSNRTKNESLIRRVKGKGRYLKVGGVKISPRKGAGIKRPKKEEGVK